MAFSNEFSFDALPNDDKIYGLYWSGLTQLSNTEDESPKIYAWLKEVDGKGEYLPKTQAKRIVQSAGAIPSFFIGSLWRNQSSYVNPERPAPKPTVLEIRGQAEWVPAMASAKNLDAGKGSNNRSHDWINPSDYRLAIDELGGELVQAYHSWILPMRTTDGQEVIVPCYELYRAFYAGSSELAWRLLTAPWSAIKHHFIHKTRYFEMPDGVQVLELDLTMGVGKGVIPFIGALVSSEAARRCANLIHVNLLSDTQADASQIAWIKAVPPFLNQDFKMKVYAQPLQSRSGLLVTKIAGADFPVDLKRLTYKENQYFIPNPTKDKEKDSSEEGEKLEPSKSKANKSGKRRSGRRRSRLGIGKGFWINEPIIEKSIRQYVPVPAPTKKGDKSRALALPVGLGGSGEGDGKPAKHASLENSNKLDNVDRMVAIQELIVKLTDSQISSWNELSLVNSISIDHNEFCAFPVNYGDEKVQAWTKGDDEDNEFPRLVWVVQLDIASNTMYWIEIEHIRKSDRYCSLAFKMLNDCKLDEGVLLDILKICADYRGVWPEHAPASLEEKMYWVKAKHYANEQGGLKLITLSKPLEALGITI